jgi:hypothetical protein
MTAIAHNLVERFSSGAPPRKKKSYDYILQLSICYIAAVGRL